MSNPRSTIYCSECAADIPYERLADGTVVIHCPKCIGECAVCDCHLVKTCFEREGVVVRHRHLEVVEGKKR